jgi:hypothetical protein
MTVTEWSRDHRCAVGLTTLRYRVLQGWDIEKALTAPAQSGQRTDPLYGVYAGMKARCANPRHKNWDRYGGRGIQVCEEWINDFVAFRAWADANGYGPGLEIDRIDNNGDYSPSNCRWVTHVENMRNSTRAKLLSAFGETKSMTAWVEDARCMTTYSTLRSRIRSGWDHEQAITTGSIS